MREFSVLHSSSVGLWSYQALKLNSWSIVEAGVKLPPRPAPAVLTQDSNVTEYHLTIVWLLHTVPIIPGHCNTHHTLQSFFQHILVMILRAVWHIAPSCKLHLQTHPIEQLLIPRRTQRHEVWMQLTMINIQSVLSCKYICIINNPQLTFSTVQSGGKIFKNIQKKILCIESTS